MKYLFKENRTKTLLKNFYLVPIYAWNQIDKVDRFIVRYLRITWKNYMFSRLSRKIII